jgi:hypothetical protein
LFIISRGGGGGGDIFGRFIERRTMAKRICVRENENQSVSQRSHLQMVIKRNCDGSGMFWKEVVMTVACTAMTIITGRNSLSLSQTSIINALQFLKLMLGIASITIQLS